MVVAQKIILGIPAYGYEWETLSDVPRSGIIPATAVTASSRRVEQLLKDCQNCTTEFKKYIILLLIIFMNFPFANKYFPYHR